MAYLWKHELEEKGFKEKEWQDWEYKASFKKSAYVERYLSPSIENSECGWNHCRYYIFERDGIEHEFVGLFPMANDNGCRYYEVSGLNTGGIAEMIWGGVFK